MRILYIHQYFSTPKGATGTRSYEFAKRLVQRGHKVTMIAARYDLAVQGKNFKEKWIERESIEDIEVWWVKVYNSNYQSLWHRGFNFLKFAILSSWIVLKESADVVFATSTPLTVCIPAILGKVLTSKKFIFEVRDLWPELPVAMGVIKNSFLIFMLRVLEWAAYHSADHIVALSPGMKKGIEETGIESSKVTLIPNGCDLELFKPFGTGERKLFPGVRKEDFICLYCGAHGRANGLDAVLDVASVLQNEKQQHIKFVFVGEGALRPSLINRVQKEELKNCVFLPPISKNQLAQLLPHVDVGLMILSNVPAFYYGTSPNKFFDYLSSGLCVITNHPGWVADLIESHQCGKQIMPGDVTSFAETLIEWSFKREDLKAMGLRSRRLAETQFDRDLLAGKFIEIIEGVKTKDSENKVSDKNAA